MSLKVYLDHNATTYPHPEILKNISEWAKYGGNPSSVHGGSREPKAFIRSARRSFAEWMKIHPLELIFTSGGSESNNTAIKGIYFALKDQGKDHFITSVTEHPSVLKTFQFLEKLGAKVDYVPVSREGVLDFDFVAEKLSEKTALVSIMLVNNETGVIYPIKKLAKLAHSKGAYFHTDAVQALGKMNFSVHDLGVDLASFSGHKFYSLKGTGILYQKRGTPLESLIHGGGQERSRRAGTENTLSIAAFEYMTHKRDLIPEQNERIAFLRNYMEEEILKSIPNVEIPCKDSLRVPNTSNIIVDGVDGETLLMNLDMHGIGVSTGAACSSGAQEPSEALRAMGLSRVEAQSSLRLSLGWENTREEIDYFLEVLNEVVARIRKFTKPEFVQEGIHSRSL